MKVLMSWRDRKAARQHQFEELLTTNQVCLHDSRGSSVPPTCVTLMQQRALEKQLGLPSTPCVPDLTQESMDYLQLQHERLQSDKVSNGTKRAGHKSVQGPTHNASNACPLHIHSQCYSSSGKHLPGPFHIPTCIKTACSLLRCGTPHCVQDRRLQRALEAVARLRSACAELGEDEVRAAAEGRQRGDRDTAVTAQLGEESVSERSSRGQWVGRQSPCWQSCWLLHKCLEISSAVAHSLVTNKQTGSTAEQHLGPHLEPLLQWNTKCGPLQSGVFVCVEFPCTRHTHGIYMAYTWTWSPTTYTIA
ncbi:hypothetical protein HaLaN_03682 [Haematococcus lacustris]|uniref:Uncharacterized protein n=1 Tax=Haematococcus lacustris TaxID=44745 RepID=A0A699YGX2_HAELA|nr:hypothetical protein HaLaN_03682 [Haematococcus lacustris]